MASIILSSVITGAITMCHNDRLEMKLGHLLFFMCFFCHFKVLIKIHEYANLNFLFCIMRYQGYVSAVK